MKSPIELVNKVRQLAHTVQQGFLQDNIDVKMSVRGKKQDIVRPGILFMLDTPQTGDRSQFGALADWELTVFAFPSEDNSDPLQEFTAGIEMLQRVHAQIRAFSRDIRFDPNSENVSIIEVTTGKTKLAANYVIPFAIF